MTWLAKRRETDAILKDKKFEKMKAFLDKLNSQNTPKRSITYLKSKNLKKLTTIQTIKDWSSSFFVKPVSHKPVINKRPLVRQVKYEESLLLSLKNHLINYPTPINLTHS
jgi:hypothetical protein